MLSAIAARKARTAAAAPPEPENITPSTSTSATVPANAGPVLTPSKRKTSGTSSTGLKKRVKRKFRDGGANGLAGRYFQVEESAIAGQSESSDEGAGIEAQLSSDDEDEDVSMSMQQDARESVYEPLFTGTSAGPSTAATVIPLSSFTPIRGQNYFPLTPDGAESLSGDRSNAVLLSLRDRETAAFVGVYNITVLSGTVLLCGVPLRPCTTKKSYRVYAPKSSPIPVLTSDAGHDPCVDVDQLPAHLQPAFSPQHTVVIIHECHSNIERLELVCRTFSKVFTEHTEADIGLLGVTLVGNPTKDIQPFVIDPSWNHALSTALSAPAAEAAHVVKGPKRVGKSSFARALLNCLLTRYKSVAFLDCDVGQSEFTPGGMVALNVIQDPIFGPPFTHPTLPHIAHYIGAVSPKSSPSHYLSAIQSIIEQYKLDIRNPVDASTDVSDDRTSDIVPLVVNTMGWSKGLGLELSRKIDEMIAPTHVYDFGFANDEVEFGDNVVAFGHGRPEPKTFFMEPAPLSVLTTAYTASDHRTISMLSHFYAVFHSQAQRDQQDEYQQNTAKVWDITRSLPARPPYEVEVRVAIDRVFVTGAGSEDIHSTEIGRVLNGGIVGLLSVEPGIMDTLSDDGDFAPKDTLASYYSQGAAPPSPSSSQCLGLGLIRSVSPGGTHLHLLTTVPPTSLSECRVLVKGELELPIWGMLDFSSQGEGVAGVEKGKVPYLQWGRSEGIGGDKRRVRRNLMRRGQM